MIVRKFAYNYFDMLHHFWCMAEKAKNAGIRFLGENLRKFRKSKRLSMQQLANIAEIEKSQIARIEIGESDPRLSTIVNIANALEINPRDFFPE